jgi:hypothetical protein
MREEAGTTQTNGTVTRAGPVPIETSGLARGVRIAQQDRVVGVYSQRLLILIDECALGLRYRRGRWRPRILRLRRRKRRRVARSKSKAS